MKKRIPPANIRINVTDMAILLWKFRSFKHLNFFSGMASPKDLGKLIEIANKEENYENKGLKFLNLLKRS